MNTNIFKPRVAVLAAAGFFFVLLHGPIAAYGQRDATIAEIQGDRSQSPLVGQRVKTRGIVTARTRNGFYIQTPDDKADANPATSEGIFVFVGQNGSFNGSIGDLVEVTGTVQEFRPRSENYGFTITELGTAETRTVSSKNPLPAPIVLSPKDLDPQKLDTMERFEGMRVRVDTLVVTGPTGGRTDEKTGVTVSDGVFFGTLSNVPRPFREPGLDIFIAIADKLPQTVPVFDTNPEILRVDSDAQTGAKAIDVTAGATIRNLTGVLDYGYRRYTLLLDAGSTPAVEGIKTFTKVSPAGDGETTVANFNIENFFDDEKNSPNVEKELIYPKEYFQTRLKKASLAIRTVLSMPDVLCVEEVENLITLKKLASRINADAVADGSPDPKYEAYLEEGNDVRGIDSGFLIKASKVKVIETKQLAKDETLDLTGRKDDKLFDRPPLMVRVEVKNATSNQTLGVTVIVDHFKSYLGIDNPNDGERVRQKRRQEADWLANYVIARQKTNPEEAILLCGDFNSFQFNDGYNDLIGALRGKPNPNVLAPSAIATPTGLADLVDFVDAAMRYSYVHDGSAQVLDHILINAPLRRRVTKFGYARVNADFPAIYANDGTRPERLSDHDAAVAFFKIDAPPPTPTPTPMASPTPTP